MYVTVSDETAYEHYRKAEAEGRTPNPPEENLRRYRFSVVINKLTETLYRLGYDLDKEGDFGAQVRICNTAGEPTGDAVTLSASEIMRAYGSVEHAMREAITHAFDATSFSFFSEAQAFGHHKFNIQELQSFILFKSRGRANKELMHLMHYYGVDHVPLFKENMERVYTRDAEKPQILKSLANSPLALRQGLNMLMPVSAETVAGENAADDVEMETAVLEARSTHAQPEPPDEPIIEDYDEEEEESTNLANENDPVVSLDHKRGRIEQVAPGPVRDEHRPPKPVVLEPPRPPAVVLKAKTKVVSRPPQRPDVRDQPERPASTTSASTVAPKARPTQSESHSSGSRPDPPDHRSNQTPKNTNVRTSQAEITRIDLTDQTSGASENLWGAYTGSLADVRDNAAEVDPQMPTATSTKGKGKGGRGRHHQQFHQEWRPRIRDDSNAASSSIPPRRAHQQQASRWARPRVRWIATGIYGNRELQWNQLWRQYPQAESDDDFWYETASGEWFFRDNF